MNVALFVFAAVTFVVATPASVIGAWVAVRGDRREAAQARNEQLAAAHQAGRDEANLQQQIAELRNNQADGGSDSDG